VEIDCPSSCIHLQSGRSYESERKPLDPQLVARARSYGETFLNQYGLALDALGAALAEERLASPWLVDQDVADVYTALLATIKTLSSGIYYETLPQGPARMPLFRRLKSVLDSLLAPSDAQQRVLRTSEVMSILDFMLLSVLLNSSGRPKSRQYLDWITSMSGLTAPPPESSRLIIP
jgi:hypothetical protein